MKKLITLIVVASLALTIQAQDITNTLGSDGNFYLKDNAGTDLIKVHDASPNTYFDFKSTGGYHNHLRLYHFGNGVLKLEFIKSNGTESSIVRLDDGDVIGGIDFAGYTETDATVTRTGATIEAQVSGTVTEANLPTALLFKTTTTADPTTRMTIKPDGVVNITQLFGGTVAASGDKAVYVTSTGDLVVGAAMKKSVTREEIQQLEEENVALKAEMAELRSMIEMLMEEK